MLDAGRVDLYDLSTDEGEARYYSILSKSIKSARTSIYRSGRGFGSADKDHFIKLIASAEEEALGRGVEIIRVQTADRVTPLWAEIYSRLIEKYPGSLRIYADFRDPVLVNIGMIDPGVQACVVQILFESVAATARKDHKVDAALSMPGPTRFSLSLQAQFEAWVSNLEAMTSTRIRDLARDYYYFAYGSNMLDERMKGRERCPNAVRLGMGVLYGWKRNYSVTAHHLNDQATAGIEISEDTSAFVEGVVYQISPTEKERLDRLEAGGYEPQQLEFKLGERHVVGFAHVPSQSVSQTRRTPSLSYLDTMVRGAQQDHLIATVTELLAMRAKVLDGDS